MTSLKNISCKNGDICINARIIKKLEDMNNLSLDKSKVEINLSNVMNVLYDDENHKRINQNIIHPDNSNVDVKRVKNLIHKTGCDKVMDRWPECLLAVAANNGLIGGKELAEEILKNFNPIGPVGTEWLSNVDIDFVMAEYARLTADNPADKFYPYRFQMIDFDKQDYFGIFF